MTHDPTPPSPSPAAQASTRPLQEARWALWGLALCLLAGVTAAALGGWQASLMTLGVVASLVLLALTLREQALLKRLARAAEAMAALDLPFLILDSEDRVRWASAAFARLYPGLGVVPVGMRYEELARRAIDSGAIQVPAASRSEWLRQRLQAHAGEGDVRLQPMQDGRTLQVVERRTRLKGWTSVYFDVSALAATEQKLREALEAGQRTQQMLQDALDALPAGFEIWDRDDRLLLFNQRLVELYPGSAEYLRTGVRFDEAARIQLDRGEIPAAVGRESEWLGERLAQRGKLGRPFLIEYAGRWIQVDERRTRNGHLVCVRQDVSELVEARRALSLAQARSERQHRLLEHAIDAMPVAVELYDEQDRLLMVNRMFRSWHPQVDYDSLLGRRFEEMLLEAQSRGMLPVDAAGDPERWMRERLAQRRKAAEPLVQCLPDGRRTLTQEAGTPDGLLVVTRQDVTELVRKEQALSAVHAQLQAIVDTAGVAIATIAEDGRLLSLNQAAARLGQRPLADMLGQPVSSLLAPEVQQAVVEEFNAYLRGQPSALIGRRRELPVLRADGSPGLISAAITEVRSGDERLFVAVFDDITEQRLAETALREANARLEQLSATDPLTGLANRRHLMEQLQRLWLHGQREHSPIAALLIDVDHFKRFNDHHGHQAGDAALQLVATLLQQAARRGTDLAARYGGEEFVLLLDHCDADGARERAEVLRRLLIERALPHGDAPLGRLSVSIGVASLVPVPTLRPEELFSRADAALYRAKDAGRDRVSE
ncbi:diguanylate cyclase domain-containing protein [Inhella sp.]|uniref:sensor domain-containing diguanylate cyclase n=1 Tax=Inhella sp. TaxID=1921806 RepID=UPI0035B1C230